MISILFTLQDGIAGGTEKRVVFVAKGLIERGYRVAVAIPKGGEIGRYLRQLGVPVEEVGFIRFRRSYNPIYYLVWLIAIPLTVRQIMRVIKRREVKVIYTNQISQLQPAIAARLMGKKVIWHLIDLHIPWIMDWIFFPLVKALSHMVVVSCRYRINQLKTRRLDTNGIQILHAPVDTKLFKPIDGPNFLKKDLGISEDRPLVGMACNINYNKGVEYFLEAAAKIKKKFPDAQFVIIGRPIATQKKYYEKIIAYRSHLGLESDVIITGYRDDMPECLASLDVFVLPSLSEASPLVILEAMACGIPVVATRVGGVPEIVIDGKTGYLVPPKDPLTLAKKVVLLLKNRELRLRMGQTARKRVQEYFDIEHVLNRVESIIQETCQLQR